MSSAAAAARSYVLLQAAVAEAALGELEVAQRRVDALLAFDDATMLSLLKITSDLVGGTTLVRGNEWTTRYSADPDDDRNIEERFPPERVFTLRTLAAWSENDIATVEALFHAVAGDPARRDACMRDVFEHALDWTRYKAGQASNPQSMTARVCTGIKKWGRSITEDWTPLPEIRKDPGDASETDRR